MIRRPGNQFTDLKHWETREGNATHQDGLEAVDEVVDVDAVVPHRLLGPVLFMWRMQMMGPSGPRILCVLLRVGDSNEHTWTHQGGVEDRVDLVRECAPAVVEDSVLQDAGDRVVHVDAVVEAVEGREARALPAVVLQAARCLDVEDATGLEGEAPLYDVRVRLCVWLISMCV